MEPAQNQILQQYPFPNTSVLFRTQLIISAFKVQSRIKPNKNPASWPLRRTDLPHRNPCIPSSADFPLYKTQFCSHPKSRSLKKKKAGPEQPCPYSQTETAVPTQPQPSEMAIPTSKASRDFLSVGLSSKTNISRALYLSPNSTHAQKLKTRLTYAAS